MPAAGSFARSRQAAERAFHDAQAADRQRTFTAEPRLLQVDTEAYLSHETWMRPAFAALGTLRGRTALDYGCGHGMAAVVLARAGATVAAVDLSPGYIAETEARAIANRVRVRAVVGDGEALPFADHTFDVVWGNAILHHLNLPRAAAELRRVLKPGGVAVFAEPWGGNPVARLARTYWPYRGKHRTRDERPLMPADLLPLRAVFPTLSVTGFQVLGALRRLHGGFARLEAADARLLRTWPRLQNWARYVVLTMRAN